jgi:hypothetical protein
MKGGANMMKIFHSAMRFTREKEPCRAGTGFNKAIDIQWVNG